MYLWLPFFLAVLSTNHAENNEQQQLSFFGMNISFELSSQTISMVGSGFYFFVGYCLLSILGAQLLLSGIKKETAKNEAI
jgi:paraquat-inducible protein A